MFSKKHFSWKKWLVLTIFMFTFTFLLAYFLRLTGETKESLITLSSFTRRLITALAVGLFISFMNTQPKQ